MNVLVDTSVWSLALRRPAHVLNPNEILLLQALTELIKENRTQMIGPVRQELLSGVRDVAQFDKLRDHLRDYDNPSLTIEDYEEAASFYNRCRTKGIAGSLVDFLICAVAHRRHWFIFSADRDFVRFAEHLDIDLFVPHK